MITGPTPTGGQFGPMSGAASMAVSPPVLRQTWGFSEGAERGLVVIADLGTG